MATEERPARDEDDPLEDTGPSSWPQFGTGTRIWIAILSVGLIVFWAVRGSYVAAAVILAGLILNEVLIRRR